MTRGLWDSSSLADFTESAVSFRNKNDFSHAESYNLLIDQLAIITDSQLTPILISLIRQHD